MKWFDRWFTKKCKQAWSSNFDFGSEKQGFKHNSNATSLNNSGLAMTIYAANGGIVIEFRNYDKLRDSYDYVLHIIAQDANFDEQLGQIISYEMLKQGMTK